MTSPPVVSKCANNLDADHARVTAAIGRGLYEPPAWKVCTETRPMRRTRARTAITWTSRLRPAWRLAGLGLLTGLFLAGGAAPAAAGDYFHVCRTADGSYEMNDGDLYRVESSGNAGSPIPYRKLDEVTLKRETGYCESQAAPGQQFKYESRSYSLRAAFTDDGQPIEATFICELASDGLPAAYACDRQVVTSSSPARDGADGASSVTGRGTGASLWLHNGSFMRLEASGEKRVIRYDTPRKGMLAAGARRGTVLFEGRREGETYSGVAYVFAKGCPPSSYAVAGEVSADERRITMTGNAPRLDRSCRVTGTRADTLVFTYKAATD